MDGQYYILSIFFTFVLCVPLSQHPYLVKSWIVRLQAEIGKNQVGSYSSGQECIMSKEHIIE